MGAPMSGGDAASFRTNAAVLGGAGPIKAMGVAMSAGKIEPCRQRIARAWGRRAHEPAGACP